jgi:uncharacterized damage-inducible protein DinB
MNLQDVRTLLDYHYWARDRMFEALEPLTAEQYSHELVSSFRSIHETVVHTYSAEWNWYSRWTGTSPTDHLAGSRYPDVASLRRDWVATEAQVRAFVDAAGDEGLARIYEYKMFNGTPTASPLWQMAQHIVNHASYHRGQVTTMLRQLGAQPPKPLDMIAFYRTQGLGARG